MKHILTLIQFLLGFLLGVMLLAGGTAAAAYYFFTKMSVNPPKPVFSSNPPKPVFSSELEESSPERAAENSKPASQKPSEEQKSSQPVPVKKEQLEPGAYYARVTWPEGLSLRDGPSADANRIGGIPYKAKIIILEDSNNNKWQKVRIPSSSQEAWVKAGNVKKVDD